MNRKTLSMCVAVVAVFFAGTVVSYAGGGGSDGNPGEPPVEEGATRAAVGPQISEMRTVNLTPCRIVDTRFGGGGRVGANQTRNYDAKGSLSGQGGSSNCGIPEAAEAIEGNITAVNPTSNGFLRVKAFDGSSSLPTGTVVNYGTVGVTNGTSIPLCTSGCGSGDLTIGAFGNSTDIVIDVTAYSVPPMYAVVDAVGTSPTFYSQKRFASVTSSATGVHLLNVGDGTDIRGCGISATLGSTDTAETVTSREIGVEVNSSSQIQVETYDSDGLTAVIEDFVVVVSC